MYERVSSLMSVATGTLSITQYFIIGWVEWSQIFRSTIPNDFSERRTAPGYWCRKRTMPIDRVTRRKRIECARALSRWSSLERAHRRNMLYTVYRRSVTWTRSAEKRLFRFREKKRYALIIIYWYPPVAFSTTNSCYYHYHRNHYRNAAKQRVSKAALS